MEIQSLVRAGKMQRIKSTAVLRGTKSGGPSQPPERKISINSGSSAGTASANDCSPSLYPQWCCIGRAWNVEE